MSSLLSALAKKFKARPQPKAKFICPHCKRPLFFHASSNVFYCEFCRVPYGASYIMSLHKPS